MAGTFHDGRAVTPSGRAVDSALENAAQSGADRERGESSGEPHELDGAELIVQPLVLLELMRKLVT